MTSSARPLVRLLSCVASGTLLFLACAKFDVWPLAWLGMVPMLFVVLDEDNRHPFFYGWVCGLLANGGGFYWINGLLERFGHMPFVAAAPIFALLIAYQALAFGLFALALRRLRDGTKLPIALLAPVVMTAVELIVPFPFPWYLAITQAWVRPVIQIADLTGPLGVTFVLVASNGALYQIARWAISRRSGAVFPKREVAAVLALVAATLVYGQIRIHQVEARRAKAPHVKVGIVQANIGITEKFVPGLAEHHLRVHQELSEDLARRGAELIVWPESSYPYAFARDQAHDYRDRRRVQDGFDTQILFGAITWGRDTPYPYNSALMLDESGNVVGRFDKNFLLVFGEYIPFYEHIPWFRKVIPEASNFARGDSVTSFPFRDFRIGPMICYEDIIPSFGRRVAAERPNLFVNMTNDAWFGATSEPYEHLALAVYRAVEHRLDLVRAVNTGVSAFVDATGRVVEEGPAVDPGDNPDVRPVTLLADTAMLDAGGLYQSVGDLFGALNLLALLGLGAWARKRNGRPVRIALVGVGAVGLLAALLVAAAALSLVYGGQAVPTAMRLLAYRALPADEAQVAFSLGLWMILFGAVGALLVGFGLGRVRGLAFAPKLEATAAALLVVVAPALVVGRIEGSTAIVVATALGSVGLARLGVRWGFRAAVAPAASERAEEARAVAAVDDGAKPEPPPSGPKKKKKKKR